MNKECISVECRIFMENSSILVKKVSGMEEFFYVRILDCLTFRCVDEYTGNF